MFVEGRIWTFRWSQFRAFGVFRPGYCWVPDKTGMGARVERRLLLEIMRRFVALPWVRKLGPLAPPACADRWRRGFPAIRRSPPGRKVHSVMVCRRPSPFDLGPFEAGY